MCLAFTIENSNDIRYHKIRKETLTLKKKEHDSVHRAHYELKQHKTIITVNNYCQQFDSGNEALY